MDLFLLAGLTSNDESFSGQWPHFHSEMITVTDDAVREELSRITEGNWGASDLRAGARRCFASKVGKGHGADLGDFAAKANVSVLTYLKPKSVKRG